MSLPAVTPESIAALGDKLPRSLAPKAVRERLGQLAQSVEGKAIVTCSGGADSVALTVWIRAHFPALYSGGRLHVVHVHHGLRGADADADACFVQNLGEALHLPTTIRHFRAESGASEAALRNARQALLGEVAAEVGAESILFGHQADDVLENLLFRLARGSSIGGLAGLRAVQTFTGRPIHLRPLLRVPRAKIEESLFAAGIGWREDVSNRSAIYTRNHLRSTVVPALEAVFPNRDLRRAAAAVHEQLGEADALVESLADEWFGARGTRVERLPRKALESAHPAVRRKILEKWARSTSNPFKLPRVLMEAIMTALAEGKTGEWVPATDRVLLLNNEFLESRMVTGPEAVSWREAERNLPIDSPLPITDGKILRATMITLEPGQRARILRGKIDPDREAFLAWESKEAPLLTVRFWRPGDSFRTLGSPGRRKLQDCFTDRGVPQVQRHRLPLICSKEGEILWVPGFPPAESRRLGGSTGRALWLTYQNA